MRDASRPRGAVGVPLFCAWRPALVTQLAALSLLVAGCGSATRSGGVGGETVQLLRSQAVVTSTIPGTTSSTLRATNEGTALGKPVRASVVRTLTLAPGTSLAQAQAATVDIAHQDGWGGDISFPSTQTTLLTKQVNRQRLELSVSTGSGPSNGKLVLVLTAGELPPSSG